MKKQTISALLTAFMILLSIVIVILVIKIVARGPKPVETAASENAVVEQTESVSTNEPETEVPEVSDAVLVAVPNTSSSVNVRSGPGTEYNRLGSAYSNSEYEVIEVFSNGWTELSYDGKEGYISSEYLQYSFKTVDSDGNASYSAVEQADLTVTEYTGAEPPENTVSEDGAVPEENPEETPE